MVPKAEQAMPEVLAAAETLTHAAEREIAWMFLARIATLRAIHRDEARVFNPDRKDTHLGQAEAEAESVSVNQGYSTRLTREPDAAEITGC
jgi:molybdopterin-guanine dinucleotide biosynthesis protein